MDSENTLLNVIIFEMEILLKLLHYVLYGLTTAFTAFITIGIIRKQRRFKPLPWKQKFVEGLLLLVPLFIGLYLIPFAFEQTPSFIVITNSLMLSVFFCYTILFAGIFFPHDNKYYNLGSTLVILSLVPSLANASIIFMITNYLNVTKIPLLYLSFYFALAVYLFVITTKIVKASVLDISKHVIEDINLLIINSIFSASFESFEKIEKGTILTVLNDDIQRVTIFCNNAVNLYSGTVTVLVVLIYLLNINFWAASILFFVIGCILFLHYSIGKKTAIHFRKSAEIHGKYMDRVLGFVNGFKELVLHESKRRNYKQELEELCISQNDYTHKAYKKYIDRVLVSDIAFIFSIGLSCFLLPTLFNLNRQVTTTYIVGALFLWGPLNIIVKSVPDVVGIRTAWKRINEFILSVKGTLSSLDNNVLQSTHTSSNLKVEFIRAEKIFFEYAGNVAEEKFAIGPLDFEARSGEITFIIGGNGSGKTTLAKLLTGLYDSYTGTIKINDKIVTKKELGEYFSVIFSDFHVFEKLYMDDVKEQKKIDYLICLLNLKDKVSVQNNEFSNINLSRGQTKRLAILRCFLEDRPIFMFDECAADQDPEFKQFFYQELLPKLKSQNKTLIIITHDDRFFYLADRVYKMEMGQMTRLNALKP